MKTHQEKLNELTEAIRKSIPRLMELSEGCVIKLKKRIYKFNAYLNEHLIHAVGLDTSSVLIYTDDDFIIIGHEPLLNDVLEWHSLNGRCKYSHFEVSKGEAYFSIYDGEENESINWDLSKLKLSDQSEELINFLHDLIPNK